MENKSGEIEGSVLIGNIKIEFVYESKDCADRYNLLFVKKDESGISAIYADTEGRTFFNNVLAERIANTENLKKAGIIKQYLSEYEYLLTKEKKCDFKPFDQVLVRAARPSRGTWSSPVASRAPATSTSETWFGR